MSGVEFLGQKLLDLQVVRRRVGHHEVDFREKRLLENPLTAARMSRMVIWKGQEIQFVVMSFFLVTFFLVALFLVALFLVIFLPDTLLLVTFPSYIFY